MKGIVIIGFYTEAVRGPKKGHTIKNYRRG